MHDQLIKYLETKAYNLRVLSLEATTQAGSGHPTSCLSAADIIATLFFHVMKYNPADPNFINNDQFILSKGHAAPVLYSAWQQVGVLTYQELLTLRNFDSILEGHPTPRFSFIKAATGSLGCGLSIGLGLALSARLSKNNFYTYVLIGDSEMAEGSIWEALELASYYKVDNLIAIFDINRLGQTTQTIDAHNMDKYEKKLEAFGWHTISINGHNFESIIEAFENAKKIRNKPVAILACTFKGYGLDNIENKLNYHGKAFSKQELPKLLENLKARFPQAALNNEIEIQKITVQKSEINFQDIDLEVPKYNLNEKEATRKAYGKAITAAGYLNNKIIALDAEVKNSTFAEIFEKQFPERFWQAFIAEQNMIGMAQGFNIANFIPFASTFGAFFTRAHDQIRMASISRSALRLAGSHAGVSIGEDGPSQMALEDISLFNCLPESIILYPADAVSTFKLVNLMANYNSGISYIRLTRSETEVIYNNNEEFKIGGCKVLFHDKNKDQLCIIAAGITLYEALKAREILLKQNISVSIIDLYCVKPIDHETIYKTVLNSGSKLITVEDHYIQGGIGQILTYAMRNNNFKIECLAIKELPRSGSKEKLLSAYKIDSNAIIETAIELLKK